MLSTMLQHRVLAACVAVGIWASTTSAYALVPSQDEPGVILRALDKMNARVGEITAQVGQPLKFGSLTITARACRDTPPEEKPEAAAYLDIIDTKLDGTDQPVFHGWMFASSPALSAMEHPTYDLWVIGCKAAPGAAPATPISPTALAPAATATAPAVKVVPAKK